MSLIASFDLGTTALKCAVMDYDGNVIFLGKTDIRTYERNGFIEQEPSEWWDAFVSLSSSFDPSDVDSIIFSGQMQDMIFLDDAGEYIAPAVLYNDQRGVEYVSKVPSSIAEETSINIDGTIPIAKMLWFSEHGRDIIKNTAHILFSAKDYLIYRLTGNAVSDVTSMATTGMMNINTLDYACLHGLVYERVLPSILHADDIAGYVITKEAGFRIGTRVFAGAGDAGATTLASGVVKKDEFSINLGTSGWVAAVSDRPMRNVFNLASVIRGQYINVIPVINAGNVHNWVSALIFGRNNPSRYDELHKLLSQRRYGNGSLLCLPYLSGERFPVTDDAVRGVFIGLDSATTSSDLARSALEGVAFSLRLGLESISERAESISLIGGGASENEWAQIFSSVFRTRTIVPKDPGYLSVLAMVSAVLLHDGLIDDYDAYIRRLLDKHGMDEYLPDAEMAEHYDDLFERFRMIYPAICNLF